MASHSCPHTSETGERPKSKTVTTQHTLERVRNNQRRHRARRRDYIATLEQKLSLAEQSVTALQDQVDALRAELAQVHNHVSQCPVLPDQRQSDDVIKSPTPPLGHQEIGFQAFSLLPAVAADDVEPAMLTPSTPLPTQFAHDEFLVDVIPKHPRSKVIDEPTQFEIPRAFIPLTQSPKHASETPLTVVPILTDVGGTHRSRSHCASDLARQPRDYQFTEGGKTLASAIASPDPTTTISRTCCSGGRSSKLDNNQADEQVVVLSRENPPLSLGYMFQPAMESYYRHNIEGESTMPCVEAYTLIAQQNFKGFSQKDVEAWLWQGFRKSIRRDEGCRVKTDLLFGLLTFISDA